MKRSTLFILLLTLSLAWAQPGAYTVQPGDTLTRIAARFGVSVSELVGLNNLANPNALEVGQVLTLAPDLAWPDPLPAPFSRVTLTPPTSVQGRALMLSVETEADAPLRARFLGVDYALAPIPTSPSQNTQEAVLAAPVLQEVGVYPLEFLQNGEVVLSLPVRVASGDYARENINLSPETSKLLDPALTTAEAEHIETLCRPFEAVKRWNGPFRSPVADPTQTSAFGTLRSYNGGPYGSFHRGQDLRGTVGTPITAPADGVVVLAEPLTVRGDTVILRHGLGVCSVYNHLSEIGVKEGDAVTAGTLLGEVGDTGLVTGPHLHWEVRVLGVPVSPAGWVE